MKDAYYFSHDSNARHDPKMTAMRSVYGAAGYGWFWILVEMMRDSADYKLDMQSKYIWNAYAQQMGCTDAAHAKQFIMDCINEFELFTSDDLTFWSNSLLKRMKKREVVVEQRRKAARTRWEKYDEISEPEGGPMQLHDDSNANASVADADAMRDDASAMQNYAKERKVKESKVNENKEKEIDIYDRHEIEERIRILINELRIKGAGVDGLETAYWYIGRVEPGVIEKALKKAEGTHINYFVKTINGWIEQGKTTVESISSFPKSNGDVTSSLPESLRDPQPEAAESQDPDPEFESLLAELRSTEVRT
ncbi:Lin1244/Lin1753 domain-containing protein [Paenibacillus ginsengarvi]|uniref:DUF4373 domain-containing protein n=1 Tax=Paenibacillus ginsengarvi TaxID=400777 RepID=A0A3B0CVB3_9BACL|nr:Lin1244/Lin1753 domain-containing protein [Paenibacillus ginsengarvi]RKN86779.1 DUF4373 domain-containing protein [Paenibacillus ginsengarvi]